MTLLVSSVLCAALASGVCAAEDTIRSVQSLDDLLQSGRTELRPFELTGQVLQACTPCRKSFFLTDGSNIVRLVDNAHWPDLVLTDGDLVRVAGRTVRQKNESINPDCFSIVKLGHRPPPAPAERSIRDLRYERGLPLRAVRVRGFVRDVFPDDIDRKFASIVLTAESDSLQVSFMCPETSWPQLRSLIGAEVSVDGLIRTDERFAAGLGAARDGTRSIREPTLTIAGPEAIRVLRPAPEDPFDVPPLDALKPIRPEDLTTTLRRRTEGTVLSSARTHGFLLATPDGRLANVDLADETVPSTGSRVIVAGLPVTDLYRINLTRAIWKPSPLPPDDIRPAPVRLTAKDLMTDGVGHPQYKVTLFGRRIRLSGCVRILPAPGSNERKITIESDGFLIPVVAEPGVLPFAEVALGAEVDVTGICLMDIESWHPAMRLPRITGVRIAVGSPDDVRILSRPSWWTVSRLLCLVIVLLILATGVLVWNLTLRALVVRRSSALLREQAKRLEEVLRVEERTRLATELHDTVAQNLSGLSLQLDAAERLADSDPDTMKSILAFVSKALLACRRELRDCLWDLRSQALDEKDMNAAIRRALTPHLGTAQLITRFSVPRRKLADHTVHAVLRILGELAANAIRHGKATTIRIAGSLDGEGLKFSCSDNGCGFDTDKARGTADGHFGLQGIRDRIRSFNGSLQLTSAPGKGTRVVVRLCPMPAEN